MSIASKHSGLPGSASRCTRPRACDPGRTPRRALDYVAAVAVRIALSGAYDWQRVDALCGALSRLDPPASGTVTFDARDVENVSPAALALMVATLRAIRAHDGTEPEWLPPVTAATDSSLHPAGLGALLRWPRAGIGDTGGDSAAVSGCTPFATLHDITRAAHMLREYLSSRIMLPPQTADTIQFMIMELAENVLRHAEGADGVAIVRSYPKEGRFELAVADCGIGIATSLAKNPAYRDITEDSTAISVAVRPGVSSHLGVLGGLGLFLSRLVVAENKGSMLVRSGTARLLQEEHVDVTGGLPRYRGTLVAVRGRTDRPFDYDLIDQVLGEPGGATSG